MTVHARRLALLLALACLLALVPAGVASAASPGVPWNGHTSEGSDFGFRTVRRDGVRTIVAFRAVVDLTCSVTDEVFRVGLFAFGFDIPVVGGDFAYDDVGLSQALHWSGHLGTHSASGSLSFGVAALTPQEEGQVCGTGSLQWKANREGAPSAASQPTDVRITILGGGRSVRVESATVTRVTGAAPPKLSFFGKTRQDLPIGFDVIGRPGERFVETLIFGTDITCPQTPGLVIGGFWFAEGRLAELDHGVWGIDAVFFSGAFHVHGTIATDPARGTLRDSLAAFTEDEEVQVCTTGDIPWKAERVTQASDDEGTTSHRAVTRTAR